MAEKSDDVWAKGAQTVHFVRQATLVQTGLIFTL